MSGYPPEMQESIRKVEVTRARRIQEIYPAMSMEEREAILRLSILTTRVRLFMLSV